NDDNPLVVIAQVHPIYVSFGMPEQQLAAIKRYQTSGGLRVQARVPNQGGATGALTFLNNTVDATTGMIQLKATFANGEDVVSPALFIRRPVLTTLLMAGILLFGAMAYRLLPVSDLPNVDFPTIQVTAQLPGASPETMASAVATPLERQFTTIAGIDSMTSTSALGLTQITIQFTLDRSIDG